jgi:hypothetical protein
MDSRFRGNDEETKIDRAMTETAIASDVFGVPTLRIGDELFWGCDATPMIEDRLANPARFASPEYRRLATLPIAAERRR